MNEYAPKLAIDLFRSSASGHSSRVTLIDNVLTYSRDGGNLVRKEHELSPEEVETIHHLIEKIEEVNPSFYYRGRRILEKLILKITSSEPVFRRQITMAANPYNPAPPEVLSTVRYLMMLV